MLNVVHCFLLFPLFSFLFLTREYLRTNIHYEHYNTNIHDIQFDKNTVSAFKERVVHYGWRKYGKDFWIRAMNSVPKSELRK